MSDRGSCKVFSPNIFNPTKCQNCYKPKEGHPSGPQQASSGKIQRGMSLLHSRDRNASIKTTLKEGFLSWADLDNETNEIKNWEKKWYVLYSSGELEAFPFEDGEVIRTKSEGVTVLQDFIRMLDGSTEIGEENSLGLKSLKDSLYLKAANKVDFENWWKELSNFVPTPMKRAYSASAAVRPQIGSSKPWLNKTYSSPQQPTGSKTARPPLAASPLSDTDNAQVTGLNSKIDKLQAEAKRIPKLEEEKRKLELEVNYWKEYVTNSSFSKKAGSKNDAEKELNDARSKIIGLTDDINEADKKNKVASAKIIVQNKEISDLKTTLEEANNSINAHRATINELKAEILSLKANKKELVDSTDGGVPVVETKTINGIAEERITIAPSSSSDGSSDRGETGSIESKFLSLREKMKRIEKELFLKSKELEKANESRSKVAKYTRTLLQELEAKLNDTQRKLIESNEKLNNANIELEMERERRKRLQSDKGQASRTSSVSSTKSFQEQNSFDLSSNEASINEKSETEVGNRYVDYYRSRFREAEAALYEKDKKLSESESKIKDLESRYKSVVKQCRSLDDIQVKLSDATHKLSDRQLKIHELTREVEKLRGYERGYDRKSKELISLTQNFKESEDKLNEHRKKLLSLEKEIEMYKIREVVMKERLSVLEEESSDESDENDDTDDDGDTRLERSVEAKRRVETTIDLEGQVRLLTSENEKLKLEQSELREKISEFNAVRKESLSRDNRNLVEENKNDLNEVLQEKDKLTNRVVELEEKIVAEEDRLYRSISELKDKHKNELESLKSTYRHEMAELAKLKEENTKVLEVKDEQLPIQTQIQEETVKLLSNIEDLEKQTNFCKEEIKEKDGSISEKNRQIAEFERSLQDLNDVVTEKTQIISQLKNNLKEKEMQINSQLDKIDHTQKLFAEKSEIAKKYEDDNSDLREFVVKLENTIYELREKSATTSNNETDGVDAGIGNSNELWEELKKARTALLRSQSVSNEFRHELEDIGSKYSETEQKMMELARELEIKTDMENELHQMLTAVDSKMDSMHKQLGESRDSMQTKADYLEKERNNVIHLVNVTSAYITELENSLMESRGKIDELQNVIDETRSTNGKRMPPEGSTGKERDDSLSDHSDIESSLKDKDGDDDTERLHLVNQELNSTVNKLESEILELRLNHEKEKDEIQQNHSKELQVFVEKLQSEDVKREKLGDGNTWNKAADQLNIQAIKPVTELDNDDDDNKEIFGSKSENMDLLRRIQELELELEETRQRFNVDMKAKNEKHKKELDDLKDDMAKVLQASASTSYQPEHQENDSKVAELEEKIRDMEKDYDDMEEKYEEELRMEREAHQYEMEETIRDMLTVTEVFKSGKYSEKDEPEESDSPSSQKSSRRSSIASGEGIEEIKKHYEKKLAQKEREFEKETDVMKQDMITAIEAMQHGGASTALLELTNKNQAIRKELDQTIASFEIEREDLKVKIEKLESGNFFGLRRNEEMGTKIYQMQIELEELERKHNLELEAYRNQNDSSAINELVKVNEDLNKKIKKLETDLETSREKSIAEMELLSMKIHEEKRMAVSDMTDTVLSLEAIIDEMKEKHELDIREFEDRSQEEKYQALDEMQRKIDELESMLSNCRKDCENKLDQQSEEHKKEVRRLEEKLNSQLEYYKVINEEKNDDNISENFNVNDAKGKIRSLENQIEEHQTSLKLTVDEMQMNFERITQEKQKDFDNQINEIRNEYEEKLKSAVKENSRRQSVSSKKTESQRIKELTAKIEELSTINDEQKQRYETEIEHYKIILQKVPGVVTELKDGNPLNESSLRLDSSYDETDVGRGDENDTTNRMKELESQIERFEKRIDHCQKATEDDTNESTNVEELQQQVVDLKHEMEDLTEIHKKTAEEVNKGDEKDRVVRRRRSDRVSAEGTTSEGQRYKRWSDLHLRDVVFTNNGIEQKRAYRDRDSKKRWSDLQLKQENIIAKIGELDDKKNPKLLTQMKKDEVKSGSVARRKKLWETFGTDEPRKISRPLSSIRL